MLNYSYMKQSLQYILIGLPSLIFALLAAGYFSVYQTIESTDPNQVLPDWHTILFIHLPNLVTSSAITVTSTLLLLLAAVIGLTAEAYKAGLTQSENTMTQRKRADVVLLASIGVITLALVAILQDSFKVF